LEDNSKYYILIFINILSFEGSLKKVFFYTTFSLYQSKIYNVDYFRGDAFWIDRQRYILGDIND